MNKLIFFIIVTALASCQSNLGDEGHNQTDTIVTNNPSSTNELDPEVVGTWRNESNTSTGGGSDDIYSSTQERIIFNEDGTLASGDSQTMIGGATSDFSEQKGSKVPIANWFTKDQNIYITAKDNSGKEETAKMGRYYIENGKMLITSDNGTKLLLYKE